MRAPFLASIAWGTLNLPSSRLLTLTVIAEFADSYYSIVTRTQPPRSSPITRPWSVPSSRGYHFPRQITPPPLTDTRPRHLLSFTLPTLGRRQSQGPSSFINLRFTSLRSIFGFRCNEHVDSYHYLGSRWSPLLCSSFFANKVPGMGITSFGFEVSCTEIQTLRV